MPDVPGQVFAPAKHHPAVAVASTLERLRRRRAVPSVGGRRGRRRRGHGGDGGHVSVVRHRRRLRDVVVHGGGQIQRQRTRSDGEGLN